MNCQVEAEFEALKSLVTCEISILANELDFFC